VGVLSMSQTAFAVPVLPGKDAKEVPKVFEGRSEEYAQSRRRAGITMERVYEQVTPMGTFVVAYIESDGDANHALGTVASSDAPIDRDFRAALKDVHGFDPATPPPGPAPEIMWSWRDDTATDRKQGFAFCAPVRPDRVDRGRAFSKEVSETRRDEYMASRRALGVVQETVVLNETPMGPILCVYLEAADPQAANVGFAESQTEFDRWFKDQCKDIFPPEIDFDEPVPANETVFDSQEQLVAH
jgi:hypothetical protein